MPSERPRGEEERGRVVRVLIADPLKAEVLEEKEVSGLTVRDGLYVAELGMMLKAYVYKVEHREAIEAEFRRIKKLRNELGGEEVAMRNRLQDYRAV